MKTTKKQFKFIINDEKGKNPIIIDCDDFLFIPVNNNNKETSIQLYLSRKNNIHFIKNVIALAFSQLKLTFFDFNEEKFTNFLYEFFSAIKLFEAENLDTQFEKIVKKVKNNN